MKNAIEVTGLTKAYPNFSLSDVSFALPEGSILGLIGENGAGKTTTLKAILGLIQRDGGTIKLLGREVLSKNKQEIHEQIGVVFDEGNFHDALKAPQISSFLGKIYRNWDSELFIHYLKQFSLPSDKPLKQYSTGMKRKLSLCAALAHHPKLLILDEATSGLDPVVRDEMLDLFLEFIQQEDHAILLSSHITSDLDKIADYITFLHEGRVIFSRSKDDLLENMGVLKCSVEQLHSLPREQIIRYRENQFGAEALIEDKAAFRRLHPEAIIDPASTEEIMLFYVRGQSL